MVLTTEKRNCIIDCLRKGMSQKDTAHECLASLRDINKINKWLEGRAEADNEDINKVLFATFRDLKYRGDPNGRPALNLIVEETGYDPDLVMEKWEKFLSMAKLEDLPEEIKKISTIRVPCYYCGDDVVLDLRNPEDRTHILEAFHHRGNSSYQQSYVIHDKCRKELGP